MMSQKISLPELIARTQEWLILAKPAGWLTIPASQPKEGDLVVSHWARESFGPVWVVHRLDEQTSGVLLLARSEDAHRKANRWFERHEIKKTYHALAQGRLAAPIKKVQAPVSGQAALSQIESRESFDGAFLAQVLPQTGRRHQIRIHLASLGNPILGDLKYGGASSLGELEFSRVALHAAKLELPSRESYECPWPEDFHSWVSRLRSGDANV